MKRESTLARWHPPTRQLADFARVRRGRFRPRNPRADWHAMESHHVRVHALGVNRVAADPARHRVGRVGNRLFDERLSCDPASAPAPAPRLFAFGTFAGMRAFPAASP